MDDMQLSTGAIRLLNNPDAGDDNLTQEPVVQVLSVKKVSSAQGQDRYRLIISDGDNFMQAMLSTQLNDLVASDPPAIEKNSVIKLLTYACNVVQNRLIVICITVEVLGNPGEKIGLPTSLDVAHAVAAAGAAAGGGDVVMRDAAPPAARSNAPAAGAAKKQASKKSGSAPIHPIEGLSPYQNKWTIKARVTSKSDIRHWTNAKGEGKLFSVNLLDDTGEIKATGFNDSVDRLYPQFVEGKVYYISKARVNIAKKQFSNLNSEYEITFENSTEVQECEDQDGAPQIKYNFVALADLKAVEKDSICDILAIVKDHGDLSEITTKATQKQLKKRELTVCDNSGYEVRVTLWGKSAEDWDMSPENEVFAFKGAKVGDFGGRTLSMGGQSTVVANPDIPQAHTLRGWFDTEGKSSTFESYSGVGGPSGPTVFKADEFKSLQDIKDENIGIDEMQQFAFRGTITFVKPEGMSYPACPAPKCNKKVSEESNGAWRCEKCDATYPAPEYRYILSFIVSDNTSQIWVSCFNEIGFQIMGLSADEMHQLKEDDDRAHELAVKTPIGTMWNFGCRAKSESYQDVTRVRYSATKAAKVDWIEATKQLLKTIQAW